MPLVGVGRGWPGDLGLLLTRWPRERLRAGGLRLPPATNPFCVGLLWLQRTSLWVSGYLTAHQAHQAERQVGGGGALCPPVPSLPWPTLNGPVRRFLRGSAPVPPEMPGGRGRGRQLPHDLHGDLEVGTLWGEGDWGEI